MAGSSRGSKWQGSWAEDEEDEGVGSAWAAPIAATKETREYNAISKHDEKRWQDHKSKMAFNHRQHRGNWWDKEKTRVHEERRVHRKDSAMQMRPAYDEAEGPPEGMIMNTFQ